jgi:flagellar basal body-associated protein FliL
MKMDKKLAIVIIVLLTTVVAALVAASAVKGESVGGVKAHFGEKK